MKKIFPYAFLGAIALFFISPLSASAATISVSVINPEIEALEAKVSALQAELEALTGISVNKNDKQNLSIADIRLKAAEIDGNAEEVEDQRITILAKNNRYGGKELSKSKFAYRVELYEVIKGKRAKLDHVMGGYALTPSSVLNSEFRVDIDSDRYVSDEDRTFIAKVKIDSGRAIKESNEKDNDRWSKEWVISGNK